MRSLETAIDFLETSQELVLSNLHVTLNLIGCKIRVLGVRNVFAFNSYKDPKCVLFTELTVYMQAGSN